MECLSLQAQVARSKFSTRDQISASELNLFIYKFRSRPSKRDIARPHQLRKRYALTTSPPSPPSSPPLTMSTVAPIFKRPGAAQHHSTPPPSSDPFQPIPSSILNRRAASPATFLPVQIELSHFRPIAFRIFTKKHNLTLKSDALQVLAEYVGRKCGSEWRIMGEPLLDEIARAWARAEGNAPTTTVCLIHCCRET